MTLEQELELIEKAKQDKTAFLELYRAYLERIYKYCFLRLPTQEIAEDVTSKVFLKLVETIQDFDTSQGYRLSAWLFRVAHNEIVDYYRAKKPDNISWEIEDTPTNDDFADDYLKKITRKQQIAQVMPELNQRYQKIISLKFFAELETEEIAQQLSIKDDNVYVLLHRALKAFKQEYYKKFEKSERFI